MTAKDELKNQVNQIALITVESIVNSKNIIDDTAKVRLIGYVVGAALQSLPELEYNA